MPEADRRAAVASRAPASNAIVGRVGRGVERVGVFLLLVAFGVFLWRNHVLVAWSEPAAWYDFGRHFTERFGQAPLAYGFGLLVYGTVAGVGPVLAYLVNLPVLVLVAGLLYAFSRSLAPRASELQVRLAPVAGAVAVALLVTVEPGGLVALVSPSPVPLAAALVLISCLCVLRYLDTPQDRIWMAGAGASLALGCSTHAAAALMLVPLLALGLVLRRQLPLARAAAPFAASFAVACVPMLVHDLGAGSFGRLALHDPPAPSDATGFGSLWAHWGWQTLLLALAGIAAAVRGRHWTSLALLVPGFGVYGLVALVVGGFGADLFALDLFVLTAAGLGAAAGLHLMLAPLGSGRVGRSVATLAVAGSAVAAVGVSLDASREDATGFRIEDARAFSHHIEALVPEDGPILGERRIGEALRCFVPHSERVLVLRPRQVFSDPPLQERIRLAVRGSDAAYLVSGAGPLTRLLQSEFDMELLASFRASTYGLPADKGDGRFHVERVTRWERRESSRALAAAPQGESLLVVDVGRLSAEAREWARVYWNDQLLDDEPRDGPNYYAVRVEDREARVWLRSDGPVPSRLDARLQPLTQPLESRLDATRASERGLLSESFFADPEHRHPTLQGEGSIWVPTPAPDSAVFVAVAEVGLRGGSEGGRSRLTVATPVAPFYRLMLRRGEREAQQAGDWNRISFAFHQPLVTGDQTQLVLRYVGAEQGGEPPALALRSLILHRLELSPGLEIDLGRGGDEPFLLDGFGVPEILPGPGRPRVRATRARAELRIPLKPDPRPALLRIEYLDDARPDSAPPAAPEFAWNGVPAVGSQREESLGRYTRVTAELPLPAQLVSGLVNHLVIRSTPWRDRGIALERVTLERTPVD